MNNPSIVVRAAIPTAVAGLVIAVVGVIGFVISGFNRLRQMKVAVTEAEAGIDAVRIALARIVGGQSDIALVGGACNGERPDVLVMYEFGGYNLKNTFAPVWPSRKEDAVDKTDEPRAFKF